MEAENASRVGEQKQSDQENKLANFQNRTGWLPSQRDQRERELDNILVSSLRPFIKKKKKKK